MLERLRSTSAQYDNRTGSRPKLEPYTVQWEPGSGNIWYLTEPMEEGYQPKKYEFKEKSNLGAMEGKITFIEMR